MKYNKVGTKVPLQIYSYFGLIRARQCSAALGGPATSAEDLRHQVNFNKLEVLKYSCIHAISTLESEYHYSVVTSVAKFSDCHYILPQMSLPSIVMLTIH